MCGCSNWQHALLRTELWSSYNFSPSNYSYPLNETSESYSFKVTKHVKSVLTYFCPRLTKLVRGLWNGLRTYLCVCVCVCARVRPSVRSSTKNATSLFLGRFWFCLFYLIGLGAGFETFTQNFEIHWLCKFMQTFSKSMKNATSLSFLGRFWFCLFYLIGIGGGFKTSTQNLEIH